VLGTTWRPAFLVNVPIGVVLFWLAWRYLPAGRRQPRRLDLAGVALLSAAMLLLVLPLVLGQNAGWPAWTRVCLAASVPAFADLLVVEVMVYAV
jgi:multisubunit Na+/H+ antiporter MnhB subunit